MTELDNYPADRRTAPHGAGAATDVGRTAPDMTMPNNATTEIDPTPDSVWTEDVHGRDVVPDPAVAGSDLNRYGLGPEDVNGDVVTPRGRKVHSAPPRETIDAPPHATGDYPLINE